MVRGLWFGLISASHHGYGSSWLIVPMFPDALIVSMLSGTRKVG